jgi:hypothetical protein
MYILQHHSSESLFTHIFLKHLRISGNSTEQVATSAMGADIHSVQLPGVSWVAQSVSGYGLDDRANEVRYPAKVKGLFL